MSVWRVIDSYMSEGELWQTLYAEIDLQTVQVAAESYPLAVFYYDEYKESTVNVEMQLTIKGEYQDTEEVKLKTMPVAEVVSVTIAGSYEQMSKVTATTAQWIEDHGYRLHESMFNIYHVSSAQDSISPNWVTEVCFPAYQL